MHRLSHRGFTLIELLIAVAVVSILSMVAIPSYQDYVRRGQLPEAFTYLSDFRVKLEQYYQDHRNFGDGAGGPCANAGDGPRWNNFAPAGARYFRFACVAGDANAAGPQTYVITATGNAGRAIGHVYTLGSDNAQATTQFKGETVAGKTCWLVKGSEC